MQGKRKYIFTGAMLLALLFVLVVLAIGYAYYIHTSDDTFPELFTRVAIPSLVAFVLFSIILPYFISRSTFNPKWRWLKEEHRSKYTITTIQVFFAVVLFQPIATSLQYNVGKLLHLQRIDEMPPHQQPQFLSLEEWHIDRLRVIPIHTYDYGKWWNYKKVHLTSLFLLPIFSKETAYRQSAKAWLAFKYEHSISEEEFKDNAGRPYFSQSLNHFKKINVGGFLYFERYPAGTEKQVLAKLASNHSYFQSSYAGVYRGQSVDQDLISLRYALYFLIGFLFFAVPSYWIIFTHMLRGSFRSED
ncbi:hypothetical protein ACFSQ3_15755 [Sphingobacterium corticis]|uniref:Uncharacterized protein n=1 Tax=Sphingobacterium corticis TaxID=1812823 RepID=A0ABW5NNC2_9SPHI